MLRVVLNAWVTKTTAAKILANPATRRRQVTMTISLNPLRSVRANRRGFQVGRSPRNFGRLARRVAVCEPNSDRSPAVRA